MRHRVLVVEDNELNRRLFSHVLQLADYEVVEAVDGAEALRLARTVRPELILMDMELPRVPGLEVVRRLRAEAGGEADGRSAAPPVIAISAFVSRSMAREACASGCVGYLEKPVSPGALLASVERALSGPAVVEDV